MSRAAHQFAALPWRQRRNAVEILLITSRETGRWVIPKGWPMERMSAAAAALQEAFEEAGVKGQIAAESIGSYRYIKRDQYGGGEETLVDVFPLKVMRELANWPERGERVRQWFPILDAMQAVDELELRALMAGFAP